MPLYVRRTKLRMRNSTFAIRDLIFWGGGEDFKDHMVFKGSEVGSVVANRV